MAKNPEIKLMIGADIKGAKSGLKAIRRDTEQLGRASKLAAERGYFSKEQSKQMDIFARKTIRNHAQTLRSLEKARREQQRHKQETEKTLQAGKKLTREQREQLRINKQNVKELEKVAQASDRAVKKAFEMKRAAPTYNRRQAMMHRAKTGAYSMMGKVNPLSLAMSGASWFKGQMDAGEATLIANMMGGMESRQLTGRRKGMSDVRRTANSLGYTTAQGHQYYQQSARALGQGNVGMTRQAMQAMRGYSLDPGSIFGLQQATREGGGDATGSLDSAMMARMAGGFSRALRGVYQEALRPDQDDDRATRERKHKAPCSPHCSDV